MFAIINVYYVTTQVQQFTEYLSGGVFNDYKLCLAAIARSDSFTYHFCLHARPAKNSYSKERRARKREREIEKKSGKKPK